MSTKPMISVPKDSKSLPSVNIDAKGLADLSAALAGLSKADIQSEMKLCAQPSGTLGLPSRVKDAMRAAGGKSKMGGVRNSIMVKLVREEIASSGSATPNTSVVILEPHLSVDFGPFASVYDIFRVKSCLVYVNFGSSVSILGCVPCVTTFDPINVGAYASTADAMTARHRVGPVMAGGSSLSCPSTVNSSGFLKLKCPIVNQQIKGDQTTTNDNMGGGWTSVAETSFNVGALKAYIPSFGMSNSSTITYFIEYLCEFASRT